MPRSATVGLLLLLLLAGAGLRVRANVLGFYWTPLDPEHTPPSRDRAGDLVYDSHRDVLTLFGGISAEAPFGSDTWEWDGLDWTERTPAVSPPARWDHVTVFDAIRNRTYVIG